MREIFKQLGFDEQSIKPVLAKIKSQYKDNKAKPGYMDTVRQYQKEIADLQKAVKALDVAIKGMSVPTKIPVQDVLPHFRAGILAMPDEIPVNFGTGPNNPQPYEKTIVKNRFVFDVARAYRRQTGKRPTISIDAVAGNSKGGMFAEFLLACAAEFRIDSRGLVRRAQELIAKDAL